jgi:hypothetical protein
MRREEMEIERGGKGSWRERGKREERERCGIEERKN